MQQRRNNFNGPRHGGGGRPQHRHGGPQRQGGRGAHSTIDVRLLINKVKDEAIVKEPETIIKHKFEDFKIDQRIKNNIRLKGYMCPTPIQDQAIPPGLEGRDVIGLANTGTGKTAAFLVPLLNKMLINRASKALILAPTRELALQIQEELQEFAKSLNLYSVLCIGGSNIMQQLRGLRSHHNFVIGTPGRIIDFLKRKALHLDYFDNIVLDEADRMVDMGFINDIRFILSKLPFVRQSFFFTATLDPKVEELIRQFLKNPVKISVKKRNTAASIEQDILKVPRDPKEKLKVLIELLSRPEFDKVLVFGRTKHGVEHIVRDLVRCGIRAESIHGNKSQNQRQRALQSFKKGDTHVLVATDVAARGLDINGVSHVINYDLPATYDDYVHRIGRTGRADMKGKALTFVAQP